jgi:hypothetical protein
VGRVGGRLVEELRALGCGVHSGAGRHYAFGVDTRMEGEEPLEWFGLGDGVRGRTLRWNG